MRALLLACLPLLVAFAPAASADPGPVGCDLDDDLTNHCHAGPVHWVAGHWCAGVSVGSPARCEPIGPE